MSSTGDMNRFLVWILVMAMGRDKDRVNCPIVVQVIVEVKVTIKGVEVYVTFEVICTQTCNPLHACMLRCIINLKFSF